MPRTSLDPSTRLTSASGTQNSSSGTLSCSLSCSSSGRTWQSSESPASCVLASVVVPYA